MIHKRGVSFGLVCLVAMAGLCTSPRVFAGEGSGTRGGGGTFSVTLREGMEQALKAMEANAELPGSDPERALTRVLYREKRLQWIDALHFGIKNAQSIRATERELRDGGIRVAALARVTQAEGQVIELSLPYLLASGLGTEAAFVLAVHETGHWIIKKTELKHHSDLDLIGSQLFNASREQSPAREPQVSIHEQALEKNYLGTCERAKGVAALAIPLLLNDAGANGTVDELFTALRHKTHSLEGVASALKRSSIPTFIKISSQVKKLSEMGASGGVSEFLSVIASINNRSRELGGDLKEALEETCNPRQVSAQESCRKGMTGFLTPYSLNGKHITRRYAAKCGDGNTDEIFNDNTLKVGRHTCMGIVKAIDYCAGKIYFGLLSDRY